jgi:hypothetical protein
MTRKDYEMIARSLYVDRDYFEDGDKWVVDYIIKGLCEQFEAMNPRFDREKFFNASGYGVGSTWGGAK